MASIEIRDVADLGLNFGPDTGLSEVLSLFGELTKFEYVGGSAAINLKVEFDNGAFDGLLELEAEGSFFRFERFTINTASGDIAMQGENIGALIQSGGDLSSTTIVGDPFANDDEITGNRFDDYIAASTGNDILRGNGGNDSLDGGDGNDTALFSGYQSHYTLTLDPSRTTISDRRSEGDGTDRLTSVELLDFDTDLFGLPFNLTTFGGATGLSEQDLESIIELYIAYFNRAPDAVGLGFWGTGFANGLTLEEMAFQFVDQDETRAKYPEGTSNAEFATSVYINVLGRGPDQSGLDFWVGHLDSGALSRDAFILEFLGGARSELKPELGQAFVDQQLADRTYLDNQIDIGAYFAVHKGMTDVDNASAAMALFDGSQSSVDDAVAAIDGFYQDALDPNNGEFLMQLVGVLDDPFVG